MIVGRNSSEDGEFRSSPASQSCADFGSVASVSTSSGRVASNSEESDNNEGQVQGTWEPIPCSVSEASSGHQYAAPSQTLIFLDWDDTLFPTTDLFDRRDVPRWPYTRQDLSEGLHRELGRWREALHQYLCTACSLSDRCVIVTNSSRPWVDDCVGHFAPELLPLFRAPGGPRVVYAEEALRAERAEKALPRGCGAGCFAWLQHLMEDVDQDTPTPDEFDRELTAAKLAAMRKEAAAFYARYPGQTWKNVFSLGDMPFEHAALWEMSAGRATDVVARPARERLRTKALVLPTGPTIGELTLRLQLSRLLLPAFVRFDGDIDLDLQGVGDPLQAISRAVDMPQLAHLPFPRHAWCGGAPEDDQAMEDALDEVAVTVHGSIFHDL